MNKIEISERLLETLSELLDVSTTAVVQAMSSEQIGRYNQFVRDVHELQNATA
jgi:hypothetical protein